MNDAEGTEKIHYACEIEVSTVCPPGWAYYLDDGSEGRSACLQLSSYTVSSYNEAVAACPVGSHLLTITYPGTDGSFLAYSSSLFEGGSFYVGCSHPAEGTDILSGWSWVDDPVAANLNCGGVGCGPWNTYEPL